jgi:hypothetical protein
MWKARNRVHAIAGYFFGYIKNNFLVNQNVEAVHMKWIYWGRLYETKFQAGCLVRRMENDWWIYGYDSPSEVEVFRSRKGRYGVRYMP